VGGGPKVSGKGAGNQWLATTSYSTSCVLGVTQGQPQDCPIKEYIKGLLNSVGRSAEARKVFNGDLKLMIYISIRVSINS
jgi:hypothetical protein